MISLFRKSIAASVIFLLRMYSVSDISVINGIFPSTPHEFWEQNQANGAYEKLASDAGKLPNFVAQDTQTIFLLIFGGGQPLRIKTLIECSADLYNLIPLESLRRKYNPCASFHEIAISKGLPHNIATQIGNMFPILLRHPVALIGIR